MNIEILSNEVKTNPGKKAGSTYQSLELAYKNLSQGGKVEGKKVMSFGDSAAAFKALVDGKPGEQFSVENKKIGDFWVWVGASRGVGEDKKEVGHYNAKSNATPAPKSNYETPEERAKRQVLIVRQSSLSAAIESLKDGKKALDRNEVVELAQFYVDFVFQQEQGIVEKAPDFDDDIPY
jgi:hypothetical protein